MSQEEWKEKFRAKFTNKGSGIWVQRSSEKIESFITTLLSEERGRVIEEIADIAKRRAFEGEYKDCPAAWLTTAYKNFEKAIRNLKESP